jgi:hypothetical protein
MAVPYVKVKVSPKFAWRAMTRAEFYVMHYWDGKVWTHTEKLTSPLYDIALVPGINYEWYVEASTGETSPNPKLGEPKYWTFVTD